MLYTGNLGLCYCAGFLQIRSHMCLPVIFGDENFIDGANLNFKFQGPRESTGGIHTEHDSVQHSTSWREGWEDSVHLYI